MSGRNNQVARILSILDLLEGNQNGMSVTELYDRVKDRGFELGKRTIYRDLEALSLAGFPLFPEEGSDENATRWKLERSTRINQYFVLSARELFALFLARGALTPLRDTPFYEDLQSIFKKLEEKLGTKQKEYISEMCSEVKFEPGPQWGLGLNPEVLETVRAACSERQIISCEYFSVNSQKESSRKLGPHYLYYARGGLYLVAEDFTDNKVKVFALPRMKSAVLLDESYEGEIKTPEDVFEGAMGVFTGQVVEKVTIEFEPDVAHFVRERRWHASQRVTVHEKGKIRVHLEVSNTPELISWIMGFGPNARVVEPLSLAEKIAVIAMKTAEKYKQQAG
jgi:predicted DNA-binding transcriptional regulator YafY